MRPRLLALAVVLLGCGSDQPTELGIPGSVLINQVRWEAHRIRNYEMELTYANEWFSPATHIVSVRNGIVTSIRDRLSGEEVDASRTWSAITMDSLFARAATLEQEADGDDDLVLDLRFDPRLHYVRFFSADRIRWADDSFSYRVVSLTPR